MTYTWYFIFNSADFDALGLVSKTYTLNLETIGKKDIFVTKGAAIGITYDDVFLSLGMNSHSPFAFGDRAIYKDTDNNVWLGIRIEN